MLASEHSREAKKKRENDIATAVNRTRTSTLLCQEQQVEGWNPNHLQYSC